jgi:hypothetical protein
VSYCARDEQPAAVDLAIFIKTQPEPPVLTPKPQHRNKRGFAGIFRATSPKAIRYSSRNASVGATKPGGNGAGLGDISDVAPALAWPGTPRHATPRQI